MSVYTANKMFFCLWHADSTQHDSIPLCEISRLVFLENFRLLAKYRPTPLACDFEFVLTKLYPGRLIFAYEFSLIFVSEIAITSGRVSTVNKMSCNSDTLLPRLRVLQCNDEKPFCFAVSLKSLPDFLIEKYFDSKDFHENILMGRFCLGTHVYLYTYLIYPSLDHLTGRSKNP